MQAKAAVKRFFQGASHFGVVGANSQPHRFGYKGALASNLCSRARRLIIYPSTSTPAVFLWYLQHNLPVTPITPSAATVTTTASSTPHPTLASISQLNNPKTTSLSIITPPPVTLAILAEARRLEVFSVFLQPGTYDAAVVDFLEGDAWWEGRWVGPQSGGKRGDGGWCVLVDGEDILKNAGMEHQGKL